MKVARLGLMVVFAVGFCFCIWTNVDIQMRYPNSLPHFPQPESGRIYRFDVNHDARRYLNKQELAHVRFAQFGLYPLALVCLVGLGATKLAWR